MLKKVIRILKNEYIYSVLTRFITLVIAMAQSILVARYLGPSLQGTNSYILSIVSIGAIVVTFGMHQAYPFFRKQYGKDAIFHDFISLMYLLYAIYLIIGIILALFFFKTIELKAVAVLIPLYGYDRVVSYIALIETPNKRNTWWTIASIVDILFVVILRLFVQRDIFSAIAILVFAELIKSCVYTYILRTKPHFHKGLVKLAIELFKMGLFPMIALLMTTLNYKIDVLMLRSFEFITAAQIGVYSIGMNFADKVVLIPDTLKGVLVSKLSKGADEHEVAKVARLCFCTSILICIGFLVLGEPMINLLYGQEYNGAYSVLMICAVGSIFVGYFKLIAQYNIVNKKQIRNVVLLSFSVIVNAILNYLLIPKFELSGAAFASCVGYFLSGIIFVIWFAQKNRIRLSEMFLIQKSDIDVIKYYLTKRGNK